MVRASALQLADLGFNFLVESYQNTLKNGIHSFSARCSAFRKGCGEQARLLYPWARHLMGCPAFIWKTGAPNTTEMATPKGVRTFRQKYSNTNRFLVNGG